MDNGSEFLEIGDGPNAFTLEDGVPTVGGEKVDLKDHLEPKAVCPKCKNAEWFCSCGEDED